MPIDAGVTRLLDECITGYEALEILLWLRSHAQSCSVSELGTALPFREDVLRESLRRLIRCGLVRADDSAVDSYIFMPESPADLTCIERLAALYAAQPIEILKAMNARALGRLRESARSFADAFVVGKKKHDS